MADAADRNLLFGILALQMDFVTRDQLIAAMNAWVLDKSTPLGELLLARKALTRETHALLDALVQKHLELHGNDPEKSLAAVSSVGSVRADLKKLGDRDVEASLAHLSIARQDLDPYVTQTGSVGSASSEGQRFRILRPHARGGLGEVYVAQDEELHREVALKQIQDRRADEPDSRARFLLEAEITGGLEHPGIVPVYGLGQYADGRPFYAMRFIRGDSLKEAIERFHRTPARGGTKPAVNSLAEQNIEFRKLLVRFIDVCDAIDYAHSRGVLHRDLKPGNIMLGKYGETLVVDWGLAKAMDAPAEEQRSEEPPLHPSSASGSAATLPGLPIGTPQFMSPEQAAGKHDLLGPASDVYSLGATLYCLLTGTTPFPDATKTGLGEIFRRVKEGDFPSPRQVSRTVPAALEAICLKAMALRPTNRYPSPRDVAEDVEHWLADEPVSAYNEPWQRRVARWARRHQNGLRAAAAALAAVGLFALLGFAYWWRTPGTLLLDVTPAGARVEVAGRVEAAGAGPLELQLPNDVYMVTAEADDYFPETREVFVERGKSKHLPLTLRHHQGVLETTCEPLGSEIEVNGISYGSRIRNLALDTGTYELFAWSRDHFDVRRTVQLHRDEHLSTRLWLDRGLLWQYSSPAIQGHFTLVPDVNGDGAPDIVHNELDELVVFSGKDGEKLWSKSAPSGGQRAIVSVDLGGDIGRVIVGGLEAPGGLDVFALATAPTLKELWQWHGPARNWDRTSPAWIVRLEDVTGDGVAELAVSSRDGKAYVLNGATGELHQEISFSDGPLADAASVSFLGKAEPKRILFVMNSGDTAAPPAPEKRTVVAGCATLSDGAAVWREPLGAIDGHFIRDLDNDGVAELCWWQDASWHVVDGTTGKARWQGTLEGAQRLAMSPLLADLDNDQVLEFLLISADESQPLTAVRLADGKTIWQGLAHLRGNQPIGPDGQILRAPNGELLIALDDSLVALNPSTGKEVWRVAGIAEGVLRGDWDGDGRDEIFVGVREKGLVCLDAAGKSLWTLRLAWEVAPRLLLPDVDGDGLAEVVVHRHAGMIGLVRGPRILWSNEATAPLQATPLVTDTDGDGKLEIIQLGPWGQDRHLVCLDAATGAQRWAAEYWFAPNRAPALADWDGDGKPDIIAIGHPDQSGDMYLAVFRGSDGTLLQSSKLATGGWMSSIPAVADLNGDGVVDVAVHRWDGHDVVAINGRSGEFLWRHKTNSPNFGGVSVSDLDGDLLPDVVAPSLDGNVYALRGSDGKSLWQTPIGISGSRSPPTLADLNADGVADVLVVTAVGKLYALDGRNGRLLGQPVVEGASEGLGRPSVATVGNRTLVLAPLGNAGVVAFDAATWMTVWQTTFDQPVLASPVVADMDRDGTREVIVATAGGEMAVLDLATGDRCWGCSVSAEMIEADPAVADVDGDGVLDILIADHGFHLTAIKGRRIIRH